MNEWSMLRSKQLVSSDKTYHAQLNIWDVTIDKMFLLFLSDVNECEGDDGGCEGYCCNTIGSFYCKCPQGSRLEPDGKSCQGKTHYSLVLES